MDRKNRVGRRGSRRLRAFLVRGVARSVVLAACTWSSPSMLSVTLASEVCVGKELKSDSEPCVPQTHATAFAWLGLQGAEHAIWHGTTPAAAQPASAQAVATAAGVAQRNATRPPVIDLNIPWTQIEALEEQAAGDAREQLPAEVVASAAPAIAAAADPSSTATEPASATDKAGAEETARDREEVREATPDANEATRGAAAESAETPAATAPEFALRDRLAETERGEQVAEEEFLELREASKSTAATPAAEAEASGESVGDLPLEMPEVAPPATESSADRGTTQRANPAVRRFPSTDTEGTTTPEPGPESNLEPVAEHEVRWSPLPETVVERVRQHNRRAIEMASHGAVYSSRAEFVKALRLVAHSLDTQGNTYRHTVALKNAMVALDESADFQPEGTQLPSDLDLSKIVMNHQTTLLRDRVLEDMAPAAAVRAYHRYAEGQFAIACGQELVAADAMYGMARLQPLINAHDPGWANRQAQVAMAYYQSALQVYPKHYLAAQELGLLLARDGQFQEARDVLQQAVDTQPKLTQAWQYLAEVHRQLGDDHLADVAEREYVARAGRQAAKSSTVVAAEPRAAAKEPTGKPKSQETSNTGSQLAEAPLPSIESPLAWDDPHPGRAPSEASEPTMVRRRAAETSEPSTQVADQRSADTAKKKSFWSRWSLSKKKPSAETPTERSAESPGETPNAQPIDAPAGS